jgi:hypothetical protein
VKEARQESENPSDFCDLIDYNPFLHHDEKFFLFFLLQTRRFSFDKKDKKAIFTVGKKDHLSCWQQKPLSLEPRLARQRR